MLYTVVRALLIALCGVLLPCTAATYWCYRHSRDIVFGLPILAVPFLICFLVAFGIQRLATPWRLWAAGIALTVYIGLFAWCAYQVHRAG